MLKVGSSDSIFVVCVVISLVMKQIGSSSGSRCHDYAHSFENLKDLAQRDFETMVALKSFRQNHQHRLQELPFMKVVDTYLEGLANDTKNTTDGINASHYVAEVTRNPLAMFKLFRRVAFFVNAREGSRKLFPDTPLDKLKEGYSNGTTPLKDDLVDATNAILQIHFMYNLSVSDMAAGKLMGVQTRTRLSATHCLYIGLVAKMDMQFTVAVEWLKEAKRLAEIDGTVDVSTVQMELIDIIKEHDKRWKLQDFTDEYYFMNPLRSLHLVNRKENLPSVRDMLKLTYAGKGRNPSYWPMNSWGLCSGENLHKPEATSHLFCWHEFKVNTVFAIGPLKMEFLSRNPDVVQIHHAFPEHITEEAMTMIGESLGYMVQQEINQKVVTMTGLQSTSSDLVRVVNHIPGGEDYIHVESDPNQEDGYWIATLAIQLKSAEKGGNIVFPTTFATAVPRQHSAVFWFNTFSDGSPDYSTAHAHCPVVVGHKLAILKSIRFNDQFSLKKCALKPQQRCQVPVNGKALPVPIAFRHELINEQEYENPESLSVASEAPLEYYNADVPRKKYAFTPSSALKLLIHLDWKVYQYLKTMCAEMENQEKLELKPKNTATNEMISRYFEDFNEPVYTSILQAGPIDMDAAVDELAGNPLAAYRTFWRFENFVKPWVTEDVNRKSETFLWIRDHIGKMYNSSDGPDRMDVEDAMTGILNLQFVHDLNSQEIAEGIVAGVDNGVVLSARQCIEIGHHAIARGFYYQAIDWMGVAVNKITAKGDTTVELKAAQVELETAKKAHDKLLTKSSSKEITFYVSPVSKLRSLAHVKTRKEELHTGIRNETKSAFIIWAEICKGKSGQTTAEKSKLFCWLETEIHPSYRIRPLKMEIHSMHPKSEVVQYHDLLGEKLTAYLHNDSNRYFMVSASNGQGATDTSIRFSSTNFMHKNVSEESQRILDLVTMVTGLNTGTGMLNINSYGPGGHFAAHGDSKGIELNGLYTAMATFMFYVTEPRKGGETAFAQAGIQVEPKAGSAVMWYNTYPSGTADADTFHGGCPVIFGEKRIATQFLSYGDQTHLQCHGDTRRKFEILVNGKSKYE